MQTSLRVLDAISIPTDCPVSWDGMRGDERTRFCLVCNQAVHNLSSMASSEAEAILTSNNYNVCIRFYRRPDGTVVTRDCVDLPSSRKRRVLQRAIVALATWLGITFVSGCYKCCQGTPVRPEQVGQAEARREN
jgi:hypothetical protein